MQVQLMGKEGIKSPTSCDVLCAGRRPLRIGRWRCNVVSLSKPIEVVDVVLVVLGRRPGKGGTVELDGPGAQLAVVGN